MPQSHVVPGQHEVALDTCSWLAASYDSCGVITVRVQSTTCCARDGFVGSGLKRGTVTELAVRADRLQSGFDRARHARVATEL